MTKPIEGWVVQRNSDSSIAGFYETREAARRNYGESNERWTHRPVKITFTDEEEVSHLPPDIKSISDFNAMPEVAKETYFDSTFGPLPSDIVADAIRKDRERIWKAFNDLGYWPTKESEVYDCIFWEEK